MLAITLHYITLHYVTCVHSYYVWHASFVYLLLSLVLLAAQFFIRFSLVPLEGALMIHSSFLLVPFGIHKITGFSRRFQGEGAHTQRIF